MAVKERAVASIAKLRALVLVVARVALALTLWISWEEKHFWNSSNRVRREADTPSQRRVQLNLFLRGWKDVKKLAFIRHFTHSKQEY